MLAVNDTLQVLNLCHNYISDKGVSGLATGLAANTALHILDLTSHAQSKIHISQTGLRCLAQAVHQASSLQVLALHLHGASEAKRPLFPQSCRVEFARTRAGHYIRRRKRFLFFF
jgi:hypothetical protein